LFAPGARKPNLQQLGGIFETLHYKADGQAFGHSDKSKKLQCGRLCYESPIIELKNFVFLDLNTGVV